MQLPEIERFLHEQIPLSASMEVKVTEWNAHRLILEAPLGPNHNHLGTAFGGSLNALATLAGYVAVWLALDDPKAHVVIRESSISFRRPVRGDLRAVCQMPDSDELSRFKLDFSRKKKARISLSVVIEQDGEPAVEFTASFVALK